MRRQQPTVRKGAQEAVILFTIGVFKFAIAAGAVHEIRGLEGVERVTADFVPVPIPKVAFTLERNRTTYFVVDGAKYFHLPPSKPQRVLVLRNSQAAILADSTDRIVDISILHEVPQIFTGNERQWYRGLTILDGDVVPVVNQNAFLNKHELAILNAALQRAAASKKVEVV